MKQQFMIKTSFAALLLAAVGSASAASPQTSNLTVSATVAANCTIVTNAVLFGAYDTVAGTAVNATGGVSIACTKNATSTITLGLGANASGSVRQMSAGGADRLSYELYQQPGTTPGATCDYSGTPTVWGTAGSNIYTPTAAPSKASRTYNVCGQINAGQDVVAGSYSDIVVATVNF